MRLFFTRTPAPVLWRAFFILAAFAATAGKCPAQHKGYRPQPDYVQLGEPDQAEGRRIVADFRKAGFAIGDYYMEFVLRVMPRRGAESLVRGRMWGTRNSQGSLTRVALLGEGGTERRLLVQNGPDPAIWFWETGAVAPRRLGVAEQFSPLLPTDLTPFDLQMPFLFWSDFTYEGMAKLRGRPAHRFLFLPPAGLSAEYAGLAGARVSIDTQYRALVETELIGDRGQTLKSVSLMELKKVQEQWLVKTIDLRNETTHDKTRLSVTGAALEMTWERSIFEPGDLSSEARIPDAGHITRFAP